MDDLVIEVGISEVDHQQGTDRTCDEQQRVVHHHTVGVDEALEDDSHVVTCSFVLRLPRWGRGAGGGRFIVDQDVFCCPPKLGSRLVVTGFNNPFN